MLKLITNLKLIWKVTMLFNPHLKTIKIHYNGNLQMKFNLKSFINLINLYHIK